MVRSRLVGLLLVAAAAGMLGCDQLPQSAADLAVGECFDEPSETTDISEVQRRPCAGPHDAEVFAVLTHPAGPDIPYPVISGVDDFVEEQCVPLFKTYTGLDIDSQDELDMGWFYPNLQGWGDGDREVTCYLVASEGQLTGSRRAAAP